MNYKEKFLSKPLPQGIGMAYERGVGKVEVNIRDEFGVTRTLHLGHLFFARFDRAALYCDADRA